MEKALDTQCSIRLISLTIRAQEVQGVSGDIEQSPDKVGGSLCQITSCHLGWPAAWCLVYGSVWRAPCRPTHTNQPKHTC